MKHLFAPFVNLTIFVAFLFYKLRGPLADFVKNRHLTINNAIVEISTLLRKAREKFEAFSGKLKALEHEATSLREQAIQDAQAVQIRIINDSKKHANQIIADSKFTSEVMLIDFKKQLLRDLGAKVIDQAEMLIKEKLTQSEQQRIRQEFSTQLGGLK